MVSKMCFVILTCVGSIVAIQTLFPKEMGKRNLNVEGLNRGTIKKYEVQMALDNEYPRGTEYPGPRRASGRSQLGAAADELAAFILDYANMMRDDAFLLHNSVETEMRGSTNIKVKKQSDTILRPPCTCEERIETIDLTKNWGLVYPYMVQNITCNNKCIEPFVCKEQIYNLTILKKRPELVTVNVAEMNEINRGYDMPMPKELVRRWMPEMIPITIGCHCTLT